MKLTKAPRPYRVLCIGSSNTYGDVAKPLTPPFFVLDPDGIGYVERMAQRMAPHYVFLNASLRDCTVRDFTLPEDPSHPGDPRYGGAYEQLVEPLLEAQTGEAVDVAVIYLGMTDAWKLAISGSGKYEPAPLEAVEFVLRIAALAVQLADDGVKRVLIVGPVNWDDDYPLQFTLQPRLAQYRDAIIAEMEAGQATVAVDFLDLYPGSFRDDHFIRPGYTTVMKQGGHDWLARIIGRKLRQSMHYEWWGRPGGAGITEPFRETDDWKQ